MWGLESIIRMNAGIKEPALPGHRLRCHPRIYTLYRQIAALPVDEEYRRWLFRSLNLYADQIIDRPVYAAGEDWDDLEAIQQVALGDAMEYSMRASFHAHWGGG